MSSPLIKVTSPVTGSKSGLQCSREDQLALLDSLRSAKVINSKVTPLRRKFQSALFAASIIGDPNSGRELTEWDKTRLWHATAARWALWTTRQHWKSLYSEKTDRNLLRHATRTALCLSFDPDLITDEHVERFMPDLGATPKDVKSLKQGEGWKFDTWDWEHDMSPGVKQRFFKDRSGIEVKSWMPCGFSRCPDPEALRNLMRANTDVPAPLSQQESDKERLLPA